MKKFITVTFALLLSFAIIAPAMADTVSGSTSGATAQNGNQTITIEDNRQYEASKTYPSKRYFISPSEMTYPNAPNTFQQDADDPSNAYMLMTVDDINEYDVDGQTTASAKNMAKGGSKRVVVRPKVGVVPEKDRMDVNAPMKVVYKKQDGMVSKGIIIVVSDSLKSVAADVFAQAQVEAWKLGGTILHVKAQGWQRVTHNEGTGFGFVWTGAAISGGETQAMTGVLGAGKAWGEVGTYKHPFIIIHVLAPAN
jgi:hypothetical protein